MEKFNKRKTIGGAMLLGSLASIGSSQIVSADLGQTENALTTYRSDESENLKNFLLNRENQKENVSSIKIVNLSEASNVMNCLQNNLSNSRRLQRRGNPNYNLMSFYDEYIRVNLTKNLVDNNNRSTVYEFKICAYDQELTVGAKKISEGDEYVFYTKDYDNSQEDMCSSETLVNRINQDVLKDTGYSFKMENGYIKMYLGNVPVEEIDRERQNAVMQYQFNQNMAFMATLNYMQNMYMMQQQNLKKWCDGAHLEGDIFQDAHGGQYKIELNQSEGTINFVNCEFMYDMYDGTFYYKINGTDNVIDRNRPINSVSVKNLLPLIKILKQQDRFLKDSQIVPNENGYIDFYNESGQKERFFTDGKQLNLIDSQEGLIYDVATDTFYGNAKYKTGNAFQINYDFRYSKDTTIGKRAEHRYRKLINELQRRGQIPTRNSVSYNH